MVLHIFHSDFDYKWDAAIMFLSDIGQNQDFLLWTETNNSPLSRLQHHLIFP